MKCLPAAQGSAADVEHVVIGTKAVVHQEPKLQLPHLVPMPADGVVGILANAKVGVPAVGVEIVLSVIEGSNAFFPGGRGEMLPHEAAKTGEHEMKLAIYG